MLEEVISSLNLKPGYIALDATVGGGGHAIEILQRICPGGRLIGIDADASALAAAEGTLRSFSESCKLINDNFRNLDKILDSERIQKLDACLLDGGISWFEVNDGDRGFSFQYDAKLDMRMDPGLE